MAEDEHPYPEVARHEWQAFVTYGPLTDEQAYKLMHGPQGPTPLIPIHPDEQDKVDPAYTVLTTDMVSNQFVGCFRCEIQWSDAHGFPCPGDPVDHYGEEPVYEVKNTETGEVRRVTWGRWAELHPQVPRD